MAKHQLKLALYQGHQTSPTHLNNLDRINERISGQPLDPLLEGGAEEHDLAIGSHVIANRPDLSFEAHLEHFVSLAEQSNCCCQLLSDIRHSRWVVVTLRLILGLLWGGLVVIIWPITKRSQVWSLQLKIIFTSTIRSLINVWCKLIRRKKYP